MSACIPLEQSVSGHGNSFTVGAHFWLSHRKRIGRCRDSPTIHTLFPSETPGAEGSVVRSEPAKGCWHRAGRRESGAWNSADVSTRSSIPRSPGLSHLPKRPRKDPQGPTPVAAFLVDTATIRVHKPEPASCAARPDVRNVCSRGTHCSCCPWQKRNRSRNRHVFRQAQSAWITITAFSSLCPDLMRFSRSEHTALQSKSAATGIGGPTLPSWALLGKA